MPLDGAIWLNVGTPTDAASSSGSAHAKLSNLQATLQKPRGPVGAPGSFTTNQTSWQTALNITGRGRLLALMASIASTSSSVYCSFRLTIDGNQITLGEFVGVGTISATSQYPVDAFFFGTSETGNILFDIIANGKARNCEIDFKSSLVLELKTGTGGPSSTIKWLYEIE